MFDPDNPWMKRLNPVLFLFPAMAIYVVFAIYPTISVVEYSFTDWDGIQPERNFVGLENYERLWGDRIFWQAFRNTMGCSGVIIVLNVGLGLGLAAMLARVWKARLLIQTLIVLPVVISPMAIATIWRWMYQPTGVINQLLE